MKKLLSILLAALLLGGVMTVGLSAAAAPALPTSFASNPLTDFINKYDLKNLTSQQLDLLINILNGLKLIGFDYTKVLDAVDDNLPISAKAALHKAGLKSYPIWERNLFANIIFKYLFFGWIWM